jgi:hypothetical protein
MADTRINALSTATVSISDDFLPIDGTTAGTKKLSAYNPSFGGNATVGGTLTVNSTDDASNKDTGSLVLEGGLGVEKNIISGLGLSVRGAVTLPTAWTGAYGLGFEYGSAISRVFFGDGTGYSLKFVSRASSTTTDRMTLTDSGVLSVLATTASTSTSSGALVVGNGTSGGLGVGGAVTSGGGYYFGASADASLTRVAAGVIALGGAATSRIDINGATDVGIGFRQTGVRDWFVAAKSAELQTSCLSAGSIASYESGVLVRVRDTTASTSTSSGALVVSGGVGVAGNVSSGGQVAATGTGTSGPYIANSAVIDYDSSTARFYGRGPNTSTRPSLGFYSTYSDGTGGLTLMTFNTSGAATIASSLTTGAPSGGTAAAWKLGTVATVSPTSPNRTIEVDIGGTIYYIHAKTTNN